MKHSIPKVGAPIGNTNRLVHGRRDARARAKATERGDFYRWCRETMRQAYKDTLK